MYDIIFISYNEVEADKNWKHLSERYFWAQRVHGIKGIHQAHIHAAKQANTDMLWIVDADALLMDDFDFSYEPDKDNLNTVHVWRAKNPVNDLVYGNGGVKLFPRQLTIDMDTSKADMTTSITNKFKAMPGISNIAKFNTDPFNTWKSAFRECTKLASKVIERQKDDETEKRLDIWCTKGEEREFGLFCIRGARSGRDFGVANRNNPNNLRLINDFAWVKEQFDADL